MPLVTKLTSEANEPLWYKTSIINAKNGETQDKVLKIRVT